jgi:hypothetical protein
MLVVIRFLPHGLEGVIEKWRKREKGASPEAA